LSPIHVRNTPSQHVANQKFKNTLTNPLSKFSQERVNRKKIIKAEIRHKVIGTKEREFKTLRVLTRRPQLNEATRSNETNRSNKATHSKDAMMV